VKATGAHPLVAIASIMHESNSFNREPTRLADFRFRQGADDESTLADWAQGNTDVAGLVSGGTNAGFRMIPILYAAATPAGPVTAEAFEELCSQLERGLARQEHLDGVLLALHGAMYTEAFPHADEEVLRRVRRAVGPEMPLVMTHDFHANIPPGVVELTNALVTYQQNPHVDTKQRGIRAASILARMLAGEVRPRQALVKPPLLWNIVHQHTGQEPLKSITDASIELESRPGILAASVAGGFQYNDVPYIGPSVIVVTDGDEPRALREAERLSEMMWQRRSEVSFGLPDAATAVAAAIRADRFPVALFDVGDNVGGGSAADETALLDELLKQGAKGWVVVLNDPASVEFAKSAGIGGAFHRKIGGCSESSATKPVELKGTVRSLHHGSFVEPAVRHGGQRYWEMGHCAVIEQEHSTREDLNLLLLTSLRSNPFSLHQLVSCGIYPERQKILAVKGTVAPRAAYEPVAASIQLVDTPGATAANPARFEFHRVRPGVGGLNAEL
jgi:microcystin degradation protein MlrC